jgi:2-polyprenyl-6-methoxyphenol hydroxylase-like FAD-dependent oxidoreductase
MAEAFDAIVVGARCAGAPVAMLLARRGHKVLLVDRANFPSDTISTHLVHPPGVAALTRWGLLERLVATGCPAIHTYQFDMGPFVISGTPGTDDTSPVAYAPRRTVLDKLLVDAAAEAGVQVREGFVVEEILGDGAEVTGIRGHQKHGPSATERARVVIGADGIHSIVARAVGAEEYHGHDPLVAGYYGYFSGLPTHGRFEAYDAPRRAIALWPTHDDLTLVIAGWPTSEFEANKQDIEGHWMKAIDMVPPLAQRVRAARREERLVGMMVRGYFRKPFGSGWALVGDAGYNKDFITAQGISDAFRAAERCASALDAWLSGRLRFDEAMGAYQSERDASALPMYTFTQQFAAMQPPSPDMQHLMAAVHGNQEAMDDFARVVSGVVSPAEFFSESNIARIFAARASP